jgi:hypothetical protein
MEEETMKYAIDLPESIVERLHRYASERHQTPEEAITALVERDLRAAESQQEQGDKQLTQEIPVGVNPLAEFVGRYTADVPDITIRHDAYLAEEALATHEEDDHHADE